ncbi:MAG: DUF4097 domain-containing protein [Bacilli bacterium]|nr:DUF4097 domain-containing protein [Bacilli bacterium]
MTKKGIIILIVFLSVVCALMTGGFIYLLANNFEWGSFELGLDFTEPKLLDSISYENAEVEQLYIDSKALDIFVEESSDDKYSLEVYANNKKIDYSFDNTDKKVTFKAHNNKGASFVFGFNTHGKIVVKIPKETNLYTFMIDAKIGDIKVKSLENLEGKIKNTVGDLDIDKVKNMNIDLGTGDININEINTTEIKHTTGDLDIDNVSSLINNSSTGDINIGTVDCDFNITAKTGDIKINKASLLKDSLIDLKTGDIRIKEISGAYVEANSNVGDVKVNNNDRYAENTLTIKNKTGDIRIN